MARPKKAADEALTEYVSVRMTVATRETLARKASAAGVSDGEFIRRLIDGAPMPSAGRLADPVLIAAINRVGNNLNQLAKHANAGRPDSPSSWDAARQDLQTILSQLLDDGDPA